MSEVICLKNVSKWFGKGAAQVVAVSHVNLSISEGDFVAITGPSGSGKSSLLSMIGMLEYPDEGNINLAGTNIQDLSQFQLGRLRNESIGWVFQDFKLIPSLTVLENVVLPLRYSKVKKSEYVSIAMQRLKDVNLFDKAYAYPNELSGGQQQRVAIARALVNSPDILVADEPTGNLDTDNASSIFQLLSDLNNNDKVTIILVTHDDTIASKAKTRVNMLDGELNESEY